MKYSAVLVQSGTCFPDANVRKTTVNLRTLIFDIVILWSTILRVSVPKYTSIGAVMHLLVSVEERNGRVMAKVLQEQHFATYINM